MASILGLLLAAGLLAAQEPAEKTAAEKELAKFQGSWQLVAIEINGKRNDLQEGNLTTYILEGNKGNYLDKAGAKKEWAVLTIDPTTTPKIVDLYIPEHEKTWEGIYKVEGDDAMICANLTAEGAKERPTEFTTADRFGFAIMFFKKVGK